jgi:hypothetical protein
MSNQLVDALINGGMGIEGIAQTELYRFITSPQGLSELGIPASEPPKLLEAYKRAFKTKVTARTVRLRFGDVEVLKSMTPHPFSGRGKLTTKSWMEWVLFDRVVSSFGFVPREKISRGGQKSIRLRAPLGGLMLQSPTLGSSGFWSFPIEFVDFEKKWVAKNEFAIKGAIINKAFNLLQRELR